MEFMGKELNEWVTAKYQQAGWSMRELARRAGVSQATVSDVLSGKKNPGAKFYYGMAKAFNLPVAAIERLDMDGIDPEPEIEDDLMSFAEWREVLGQLTPSERAELLKTAFRLLLNRNDGEEYSAAEGGVPAPQPSK